MKKFALTVTCSEYRRLWALGPADAAAGSAREIELSGFCLTRPGTSAYEMAALASRLSPPLASLLQHPSPITVTVDLVVVP
jgi:hypothetical protein